MTFYPATLQELIDEFQEMDDKRERLEYLFELADEVNEFPTSQWSDLSRVRGCQSEAHVHVDVDKGLIHFQSGADAKLVQGLMGVLTLALEGLAPAQALAIPPDFAQEMGLTNTLTPSRSNGFRNMFDKVMAEIRGQTEA